MPETSSNTYDKKIQLGQDQDLLRILCDTLDVGVTILDKDQRYRFISDSVYKELGITPNELSVGDPLAKSQAILLSKGLLTPKSMERNKLSLQEHSKRVSDNINESSIVHQLADGSSYKYNWKTLENGYTVSVSTSITDLVEKDELLNQSLNLGSAGYWIYDFKTKTYTLSKSMRAFYSREKIQKVNSEGVFAIAHPEDRHLFREALKSLNATNSRFDVTARVLNASGDEIWINTQAELIRDEDGNPLKMQAFVKDVGQERIQAAELTQAKDEAIAASQAKSEFLANMSHEIRTPMNGILGMAELLSHSDVTDRQKEYLKVINNSASALLAIINDILDFSKIEAGAFDLDPVPFDLKSSISDVTSILSMKAQEKGLELIINYPTSMPSGFVGDAGRLRQVLTNLVGNALKFTDKGYITIDVSVAEPRNNISIVDIDVKDTGIGIAPEKLEGIFQKFTQADGSTTRMYGGTGLGLSISKAIVEMMGGRISVTSKLGEGSAFSFKIPLPMDSNAVERNYDIQSLDGKRALIVDDIATNRQVLSEQLRNWGIEATSVVDGVDALTDLKSNFEQKTPYDIILLDYLMPGVDGHELAKMIHNNEKLRGTPILMLSSCDQPITNQELSEIGISSYLMKPVREKRLYTTILETLSQDSKLPQSSTEAVEPVQERNAPQNIEILVAEDFPLNQDVIRLMLDDSIYSPVFANNGKEAVDIYAEDPSRFPAILMDISMPVMDGYEATHAILDIEKSQSLAHTPIVALTGHALKNDREKCLEAGMDDYLTKPVIQTDLLEKLEQWTGRAVKITAIAS